MKIKSSFAQMQAISKRHGYRTDNISPEIEISDIPNGTKAIALIVDDPDAPSGVFVHWLLIAPCSGSSLKIPENAKIGIEGRNDFGKSEYDGPSPPSGIHRYFFKAFALDTELKIKKGFSRKELEQAMQNHVLAKAELVGTFSAQ